MKIEVDVKHKPRKNEIIIFNGSEWVLTNLNDILNAIDRHFESCELRISNLENNIKEIKGE